MLEIALTEIAGATSESGLEVTSERYKKKPDP